MTFRRTMNSILVTLVAGFALLVFYVKVGDRLFRAGQDLEEGLAFPENSPAFLVNFAEAKKRALSEDIPMVVVFSASWCPPCRRNKTKLYPDAKVQAYHGRFVWVYLDVDEDENQKLANQYGVRGIPDVRIMRPSGESLDSFVGAGTPDPFVAFLARGLKDR